MCHNGTIEMQVEFQYATISGIRGFNFQGVEDGVCIPPNKANGMFVTVTSDVSIYFQTLFDNPLMR